MIFSGFLLPFYLLLLRCFLCLWPQIWWQEYTHTKVIIKSGARCCVQTSREISPNTLNSHPQRLSQGEAPCGVFCLGGHCCIWFAHGRFGALLHAGNISPKWAAQLAPALPSDRRRQFHCLALSSQRRRSLCSLAWVVPLFLSIPKLTVILPGAKRRQRLAGKASSAASP